MIRKLKVGESSYYFDCVVQGKYTYDLTSDYVDIWVDKKRLQHNEPGVPSFICYLGNERERMVKKEFTVHGKYHNLFGPAIIDYETGENTYVINGKQLTKEQWEIEANRIKMIEEI